MAKNSPKKIIKADRNFIDDIIFQAKLILRLMTDRRISFFLKLLPIASVAYLFIPDLVIGPLDDAAVLGLGFYVFTELCPQEIVEEHRNNLNKVISTEWKDPEQDDEIVEGGYKDISEE